MPGSFTTFYPWYGGGGTFTDELPIGEFALFDAALATRLTLEAPRSYVASYIYPVRDIDQSDRLLALLGSLWSGTYEGSGEVEQFAYARGQLEAQSDQNLKEAIDVTSRFDAPVYHTELWYQLVVRESEMNPPEFAVAKYGEGYSYGNELLYGVAAPQSRFAFAAPSSLAAAPAIYNRTDAPTISWLDGMQYVLEDGFLQCMENPFENSQLASRVVYDASGLVVDREIALWLFRSQWDRDYVWEHFGHIVGVRLTSSPQYKDLVNAVWDTMIAGDNLLALATLLSAVTDVPLVKEDRETVERIFTDTANLWIVTDKHAYRHNSEDVPIVVAGQGVSRGQFMTDAVQIHSPAHEDRPSWLVAYGIDESFTARSYRGGLMFLDESSALTVDTSTAFTRVEFTIHGWEQTIEHFWDDVHERGVEQGQTLAHLLDIRPADAQTGEPRQDALPPTINPLEFLLANVLRNGSLVVGLKPQQFGDGRLPAWTLGLLRRVVSPHSAVLLIIQLSVTEPAITMVGAESLSPLVGLLPLEDDGTLLVDEELPTASHVDGICIEPRGQGRPWESYK